MDVIGVAFDDKGISVLKTKMLIDEELEVLEVCERSAEKEVEHIIIKEENLLPFKTRLEQEMDYYVRKEMKKVNNMEKLKYLYYECFNEVESDKNVILSRINKELADNWDKIIHVLYNFFKLTSIKKIIGLTNEISIYIIILRTLKWKSIVRPCL